MSRGYGGPHLVPRTLALTLAGVAALVAVPLVLVSGSGSTSRAAYASAPTVAQTDDSVPARDVLMIGATPEEPGADGTEVWGMGAGGSSPGDSVLVRYTAQQGWTRGPALPQGFLLAPDQLLAARMTPRGAGAMVGTINEHQVVLARDPGADFAAVAPVPAEAESGGAEGGEEGTPNPLLVAGEELFSKARAPLITPIDEAGGQTGLLLAPVVTGKGDVEHQVLRWDGSGWTSEPIAIPAASASSFRVLAIGASSPRNAWLLGQLASGGGYPEGAVALFRRVEEAGHWSWKPVALEAGEGDGEAHPLTVPLAEGGQAPFELLGEGRPPSEEGQVLTVTSEGVWVDGARADALRADSSATVFFRPEGTAGGHLEAGWCLAPPATPSSCSFSLPQPIPRLNTRSIAWPGGGPYGQRVVTGLAGGVSFRLQGSAFQEVLSLGGGAQATANPGAAMGAAFSSPTDGWLGRGGLPVHLTASPSVSRLRPWPVPFRRSLQAIAAAPGKPVAALGSEALAVGRFGAVARYKPGQGWVPETLFGPGETPKQPNLRAVAWPQPMRAYAVGDGGQMWLWRGETGLWEPDPSTPINFRGNLLGIAFDPSEPARGYAVGTSVVGRGGVILRYGKSWTEETKLPAEAQGAEFLGIAFAGSVALVPFVKQVNAERGIYLGGILANNGGGWYVDTEAGSRLQSNGSVPVAIAGLADGGAAFATSSGSAGQPQIFEREGRGSSWQPTPVPLPGLHAGSLALFREGGALRAFVTGSGARLVNTVSESAVPPGSPGNLQEPIALGGGPEGGALLRQTAGGWSDERHEVNVGQAPLGNYEFQDLPYTPDPVMAMLVDPSGTYAWTVGGQPGKEGQGTAQPSEEALLTADVERYGENGTTPDGEQRSQVATQGWATFAIGGDAECVDPCAERSQGRVGPQVWLESAVSLAADSRARAFIYTGPSVTEGRVEGHRSVPIPFPAEFERTGQILASGIQVSGPEAGTQLPAYSVPSSTDLDARPQAEGTEQTFLTAFAGFPQQSLTEANGAAPGCAATIGCAGAYYAFSSHGQGGTVRVIVLDETAPEMSETQLSWLEGELQAAKAAHEPAIALGAGDIESQIRAGRKQSALLAKILVTGSVGIPAGTCERLYREHARGETACSSASAYFYDSREENEHKPLRAGGEAIEAYGSGTLGYINTINQLAGNFHGASGIMLAQVNTASRDPATNRAEVQAPLIPVIGELALEALQGTLLQRSHPALFAGLARRPRAGCDAEGQQSRCEVAPYIPIPSICTGTCGTAVLPEYGFKSSDPEIGAFVQRNLGSNEQLAVLQNAEGKPILESESGSGAKSGVFCAFNPGTTTVTITAGGWSASLPVTVQRGSVREPCGTVKLSNPPAEGSASIVPAPPLSPTPATAPAGSPSPVSFPPPPPPAPAPPPPPAQAGVAPFFVAAVPTAPLLAVVPPPVPTPARPSPPSGTSAVTSPVEAVEKEEEYEEAPESASNQAVAYTQSDGESPLPYLVGAALICALAGVAFGRRPRVRRGDAELAHATVTTSRAQRRLGDLTRRRR